MAKANATNAGNTGVQYFDGTSAFAGVTGSTGQVLQANTGAAPTYSTATFPSTATGTGTILRADGTNWAATTATYPATTTASQILYSSSTNVIGQITTANNSILSTDGSGVPTLGTSLSNDYTFTSSTAGATRTVTISNTDNTNASSTAVVQTTTGGGSAGDPRHTFTVTGATSFSLGIDNSASDAFVIAASTALGTTNVLSCSTAGEINYPLQPAFLVTTNTQSNVTGDATVYTILYANEIFDQNNDFSSPTFTAPVTGRYQHDVVVDLNGLGAGNTSGNFNILTSNRSYLQAAINWANLRNSSNSARLSGVALSDMDAADTATVTVTINGGTKVVEVAATTTFWGCYLVA